MTKKTIQNLDYSILGFNDLIEFSRNNLKDILSNSEITFFYVSKEEPQKLVNDFLASKCTMSATPKFATLSTDVPTDKKDKQLSDILDIPVGTHFSMLTKLQKIDQLDKIEIKSVHDDLKINFAFCKQK